MREKGRETVRERVLHDSLSSGPVSLDSSAIISIELALATALQASALYPSSNSSRKNHRTS